MSSCFCGFLLPSAGPFCDYHTTRKFTSCPQMQWHEQNCDLHLIFTNSGFLILTSRALPCGAEEFRPEASTSDKTIKWRLWSTCYSLEWVEVIQIRNQSIFQLVVSRQLPVGGPDSPVLSLYPCCCAFQSRHMIVLFNHESGFKQMTHAQVMRWPAEQTDTRLQGKVPQWHISGLWRKYNQWSCYLWPQRSSYFVPV